MTKDMTTGNPVKLLLWFSIPLLVGNIFQQFYNMADAAIVGRTLGYRALAAVGSTGCVMFLVRRTMTTCAIPWPSPSSSPSSSAR